MDPAADGPAQQPEGCWRPTATLARLAARARVLAAVRDFFGGAGYWEVETPVLSSDVCLDEHLEPFVTQAGDGSLRYLQTSPEFGMKRLVAAGASAIYQVARAFRQDECGRLHNPEFTMVEWYRVGASYVEQAGVVEGLVRAAAAAVEPTPPWLGENPFERLTYDQAFSRAVGTAVLSASTEDLVALARQRVMTIPEGLAEDDRDGWLNLLLAELVEPTLGQETPEFLFDYPASQAALATLRPGPPAVAERFELYIGGLEICNGYQELTDADELAGRAAGQARRRADRGLPPLPTDSRLEQAQRHGLPECAGVALGFDRLVMKLLGADRIEEILAFPFPRA